MIRVLLADDHQIVLDGIAVLLENEPNITIVGRAVNGYEVLEEMEKQPIDVAVLDISMPEMDGWQAARQILKKYPETKVLLLTMHGDSNFILKAIQLGVHGYVVKEKSKEFLVGAIDMVYRGASYWPPDLIRKAQNKKLLEMESTEDAQLSNRELEVLRLIGQGLQYKSIADKLSISETTVQTHSRNMKKKLGFHTVGQLVKYAIERNLD